MAILKRKTKETSKPFEQSHDIKKLSLVVTIVNKGQGIAIVNLLKNYECAVSFIQRGEGTASKSIYDVLGLQDNTKDIVISIIKSERGEEVKKEIEAYFMANKRNKGVSVRIPLSSIVGVNVYRFLANQF